MAHVISQETDPLYSRELLRLAADSHGAGRLAKSSASAMAHNPACGDSIRIDLQIGADGAVLALAHETRGCVITQASACLLAQKAIGRNGTEIAALAAGVRAMLSGTSSPLEGYEIFQSLSRYAGRHVCVLLPIEAAMKALESTEPGRKGSER